MSIEISCPRINRFLRATEKRIFSFEEINKFLQMNSERTLSTHEMGVFISCLKHLGIKRTVLRKEDMLVSVFLV